MPVSALVITLDPAPDRIAATLDALAMVDGLTLGERNGGHLPAVLETEDAREGIRLVREQLPAIPGVGFVHVVQVDFSDESFERTPEHSEPQTACAHGQCSCGQERES